MSVLLLSLRMRPHPHAELTPMPQALLLLASYGPVQPVAKISQTGNNVLVRVEMAVDHGRVDLDIRVLAFDDLDAFGRRDDADDANARRAALSQQTERRGRAAARCEHRIDHQHVAVFESVRQLRV